MLLYYMRIPWPTGKQIIVLIKKIPFLKTLTVLWTIQFFFSEKPVYPTVTSIKFNLNADNLLTLLYFLCWFAV